MAGWRDRGYVVDSDEDETSNEPDSQIPTPALEPETAGCLEYNNKEALPEDCYAATDAEKQRTKSGTGERLLYVLVEGKTNQTPECNPCEQKETDRPDVAELERDHGEREVQVLNRDLCVKGNDAVEGGPAATFMVHQDAEWGDEVLHMPSVSDRSCAQGIPIQQQPLPNHDLVSSPLTVASFASVSDFGVPNPITTLHLESQTSVFDHDDLPPVSELLDLDPLQMRIQNSASHEPSIEPEMRKGPLRSLRQRKPVQLHPYAIEGEKYRQSLKARGVVPLRIAQAQANVANPAQRESQDQFSEIEGQLHTAVDSANSLDPLLSSSPRSSPRENIERLIFLSPPNLTINDGDDFPDVDTLLRHHQLDVHLSKSHKRRKVGHTYSKPRSNLEPSSPVVHNAREYHPEMVTDYDLDMFDIPPSPPPSRSPEPQVPIQRKTNTFQFPRGVSPIHLQTPIALSESRPQPIFEVLEASDSETDETTSALNSNAGDGYNRRNSLSARLFPKTALPDLQRVQRTIKGVLPASWLRLDLKKQAGTSNRHDGDRRSLSSEDHDERPGIARLVAGSKNKAPALINPFTIDVDSNSDREAKSSDLSPGPGPVLSDISRDASRSTGHDWDVLMDDNDQPTNIGEAIEDDRIDGMFTVSRKSTKRSTKRGIDKKRQSTLSTNNRIRRSSNIAHPSFEETHDVRAHQPKITAHLKNVSADSKKSPRFIVPKLSILDTSSLNSTHRHNVPSFIRIAARTSNLRKDKGKQSPSRKHIQLATREDTEDVNETLYHWQEGRIPPSVLIRPTLSRSDFLTRPPLRELINKGVTLNRKHSGFEESNPLGKPSRPQSDTSSTPYHTQTYLDHLRRRTSNQTGKRLSKSRLQPAKRCRRPSTQDKRGQFWSSLRDQDNSRPAQLESFATSDLSGDAQQTSCQNFLTIRRSHSERHGSDVLLAKFFSDQDPRSSRQPLTGSAQTDLSNDDPLPPSKLVFPRKPRKRHPRYIKVNVPGFEEHVRREEFTDGPSDQNIASNSAVEETAVLTGLEAFGTQYPIDFGVKHLAVGQFLAKFTFVGSGEFARNVHSCNLRNLDDPAGYESFQYQDTLLEWGPWNETVSSELSVVFSSVCTRFEDLPDHAVECRSSLHHIDNDLRYVIRYITNHLYFLDPIDRVSFLQRCRTLMVNVMNELDSDLEVEPAASSCKEQLRQLRLCIFPLNLVIANQLQQISKHVLVPTTVGNDIKSLVDAALRKTLELTLRGDYEEFRRSFQGSRTDISSEHGPSMTLRVEAFLIARDVASQAAETKQTFEEVVEERITVLLKNSMNVKNLENSWANLFSLLPIQGIDSLGYVNSGQLQAVQQEHWGIVKVLSLQIFCVYMENPRCQGSTFNAYCRAIFGRCFHLINSWGWHRCETIIGILFDFFARNKLAHLRNERSHGSPLFLENLDSTPKLAVGAEDLCFHILLKVIGSGLQYLQHILPEKKIRDLVWRLMPNHGRLYPKDESVREGDLDALRNHHDLLSTLYWASPAGLRPRVSAIQNLVDLASSHQEACHVNIRAWSNLVRFQLSTEEDTKNLIPFAKWHQDLLRQLLSLHHVARTEVEDQIRTAAHVGSFRVSKEVVESTISKNQRHVESILKDALVSLRKAVSAAKSQVAVAILLNQSLVEVFGLFSATKPRINEVVMDALDVVQAYTENTMFQTTQNELQGSNGNDDSQDYGDWSLFAEDTTSTSNSPAAAEHLLHIVQEPLRQLLSNCFGADDVPEDRLLSKMVDTWINVARFVVAADKASWNDYVGSFGQVTWTSLRDTKHTRTYTAYLMARVVESDKTSVSQHKDFFLKTWITSLVERESLIKYQHQLTASLLNAKPEETLLLNMPFYKDQVSRKFIISASDFRSRRIMLISSLLSNMRMSVEAVAYDVPSEAAKLRQEYREYLKYLMAAMKHNYQELGPSADISGSYVSFIHQIVQFLQQYTLEICPIDRFFTDSTGFPLPARDPTYVIGRLRNYGLRLQDSRTPKQLVTFVQATSERAAVDGQQQYLTNQLGIAMSNQYEQGDSTKPTLRSFLVSAVFPPYIDLAFTSRCGWIIAMPILQALQAAFDNLLADFDGTIAASRNAMTSTVHNILQCLQIAMHKSVDNKAGLFRDPATLKLLAAGFAVTIASMPILDYISRVSGSAEEVLAPMKFFDAFGVFVLAQLHDDDDDDDTYCMPPLQFLPIIDDTEWSEPRRFAHAELGYSLAQNWACYEGQYYLTRGGSRRQIAVEIGSEEEERAGLVIQVEAFFKSLRGMPTSRSGEGSQDPERRPCLGIHDLVY